MAVWWFYLHLLYLVVVWKWKWSANRMFYWHIDDQICALVRSWDFMDTCRERESWLVLFLCECIRITRFFIMMYEYDLDCRQGIFPPSLTVCCMLVNFRNNNLKCHVSKLCCFSWRRYPISDDLYCCTKLYSIPSNHFIITIFIIVQTSASKVEHRLAELWLDCRWFFWHLLSIV